MPKQEAPHSSSQSMDRGSRLINLFQTLEKLCGQGRGLSQKLTPDDLQQLRYSTSKILQYVSGQEKIHRDLIIKNSNYVDLLLTTLDSTGDVCTEQNIVYILNELIGKNHTGKRISTLVSHGATHVLLHTLVYKSRENAPDEIFFSIHQVLAKLGPKDRKFAVKARLSQALAVTLSLIRSHCTNPRVLQPVLHVLKLYAANAVNASYLGKNGAVTYLFKVLSVCGKRHLTLLKYVLDTLALLVKSKSNSARAIGQGGVPVLLSMFFDWHRLDCKNRHVQLRKAFLIILKHITNLKSGRKALMEADGIRILYTASQESLESRELESIIVLASLIMRKCFPKNRLPLSTIRSPITCPLPQSDFHMVETTDSQEAELTNLDPSQTGDENDYESSVDNDDDISSDDDPEENRDSELDHNAEVREKTDTNGGVDEDYNDIDVESPYHRTWEDLCMYKKFFPELHEFDVILSDDLPLAAKDSSIVIPTGSYDNPNTQPSNKAAAVRSSQSASALQEGPKRSSNNKTLPALPVYHSTDEIIMEALQELGLSKPPAKKDADSLSDISLRRSSRYRTLAQLRELFGESSSSSIESGSKVSAVNLKTGSSIFSLDVNSKGSKNLPSKSKRKSNQSAKSVSAAKLDKHSKHSSKKDSGSGQNSPSQPLSVTPLMRSQEHLYQEMDSSDGGYDTPETEEDYATKFASPEIYAKIASKTKSVGRYNKIAYPDMYGHLSPPFREPFHEKRFGVTRQKVFEDIDRFINADIVLDRVVYDLDTIVATAGPTYTGKFSNLTNRDAPKVVNKEEHGDHLKFNSQFECGNLRKAIQVRKYEYDLILNPDVNTNHHHQWFYFEVSNMEAGVKYRFNIVNCEKVNSQFNFGMKPVLYSVTEALRGQPYWLRVGDEIAYYKNHFTRSTQTTGGVRGKSYFTTTFTITFKHEKDVCYLAYHYPYTYSMLQAHLYKWENTYDGGQIYFKNQVLCETISGNPVPVLTITSHPSSYDREGIEQLKNRPYIFLSSRVHPGESNSSWVMRGTISFLLSQKQTAQTLRDMYIFKIIPMLNPDGVINGNHRCSLVAEDLNRRWMHPCPKLHPTIYHTKGLLQFLHAVGRSPLVFCDYHGHSRRKNVFMYGCSPSLSWMSEDLDNPAISSSRVEDQGYKTLPNILQKIAPSFSINNCSFMVEKSKESTARVVVWRQTRVVRSYTMESTYCGCDQGPYRGTHISTRELEEMGKKFCEALVKVKSRHYRPPSGSAMRYYALSTNSNESVGAVAGPAEAFLEGASGNDLPLPSNSETSSGSSTGSDPSEADHEEDMSDLTGKFF